MIRLAFALLLTLAGCAPQSGALVARASGLSGEYSRQVVISNHPHHVLMGHLIRAERGGIQTRALVVSHRRDGVHHLRMTHAWNSGVALPFRATHRRLDGCTHGHCREASVGMVFFTDHMFAHAQAHGFHARLTGSGDAIDIAVPPDLFVDPRPAPQSGAPGGQT